MEISHSVEIQAAELIEYNLQRQAISVIEAIAAKIEGQRMYDQRPVEWGPFDYHARRNRPLTSHGGTAALWDIATDQAPGSDGHRRQASPTNNYTRSG